MGLSVIVEYEDGRTTTITIDRWTLRSGDHVARIVAGEWQQGGRIPEGDQISAAGTRPGAGPPLMKIALRNEKAPP